MIFQLIVGVLLVGAALGFGLRSGIDWQRGRGKSWGESCLKEYGLDEEKQINKYVGTTPVIIITGVVLE